ncbi:hypothetical protein DPMN_169044 [Dreissena polymorpha]|uniref:Uncharacterized protein n=1 Tax=Dreissena polymorpha TaxID=45954 RepID=A0A9D4IWH6_DREPO|nr:hypothetical protein DPMN_169044 [Dreissena polymorpha]
MSIVTTQFWPEEISPCEINFQSDDEAVDEAGVVDAIFDIDCDDFEDDSQIVGSEKLLGEVTEEDMTEDKYVVSRHCLAKLLDMLPFKHCSKVQNKYVVPVVNQYCSYLRASVAEEHRAVSIVVSEDWRMESPGYCAKYFTYTVMNQEDKTILALEIVDKRETDMKYGLMEAKGFA